MVNVCCRNLELLDCADTDAHQHPACMGKAEYGRQPVIDNQWCQEHCLSESGEFRACPHWE